MLVTGVGVADAQPPKSTTTTARAAHRSRERPVAIRSSSAPPLPPRRAVLTELGRRLDARPLTAHCHIQLLHCSTAVDVGADVLAPKGSRALARRTLDLTVDRADH